MKRLSGTIALLMGILFLVTLISCNEIPKGNKLTIEQAYEQYGKMYEKNKNDLENEPSFNSIYMKEESKETEYNRVSDRNEEIYLTTIINVSKDNYQYHYENHIEDKTSNSKMITVQDMYVKDEKLHFFRTVTINKRVAYKEYYICDLDYVWSYESEFTGHLEQVVGERYIETVETNLSKEDHFRNIENNYLLVVNGTYYNREPSLDIFTDLLSTAKDLKIYYDAEDDIFTFDKVETITPDVIEYNLIVKSFIEYTNGYLTEVKNDYYNGDYRYLTLDINKELKLPDFDLSEYEETEPNMLNLPYISFFHRL